MTRPKGLWQDCVQADPGYSVRKCQVDGFFSCVSLQSIRFEMKYELKIIMEQTNTELNRVSPMTKKKKKKKKKIALGYDLSSFSSSFNWIVIWRYFCLFYFFSIFFFFIWQGAFT